MTDTVQNTSTARKLDFDDETAHDAHSLQQRVARVSDFRRVTPQPLNAVARQHRRIGF